MPQRKEKPVAEPMPMEDSGPGMSMMSRLPDTIRRMFDRQYQRDVELPMEDGMRRDPQLPMTREQELKAVHDALRQAMQGAKVVQKLGR